MSDLDEYIMMKDDRSPQASVIILMYNDRHQIGRCLNAVLGQDVPAHEYEVIVVDNNSADDGPDLVRDQYPQIRLLALNKNWGFAGGNNHGYQFARGEWIVFLNSDTEVEPGWLRILLAVAKSRPDVGAVHAAQRFDWNHPREENCEGLLIPDFCSWGFVRYYPVRRGDAPFPTLHVSGATAMIRRAWLDETGSPFDETFFMYGEDRDLGLRLISQGYRVLAVPQAVLDHHQSNMLESGGSTWRKACLAARNGWRGYLKNMYITEFLLYAPIVCVGSLLKPWGFPGSFGRRLLAGLGLFALTLAYLPATLWHYAANPEPRRRTLERRTRPWGWMLARLLRLQTLSND